MAHTFTGHFLPAYDARQNNPLLIRKENNENTAPQRHFFVTFIVLSGCSSELDKCISSNEAKIERMPALELQNLDGFPHVLEADIREFVRQMRVWHETQAAEGWAETTDEDMDQLSIEINESLATLVPEIESTFNKDWYPTLPDSVAEYCDEEPSFC